MVERKFHYPFIMKLPKSTNSHSVMLVRSQEEFVLAVKVFQRLYEPAHKNRLYDIYRCSDSHPIIIQEYIEGTELNIDLLFDLKTFKVLGVFEKYPLCGPTFGEVQSMYPVNLSRSEVETCIRAAVAAVRALGATIGAAHVELRYGAVGPRVIEVGLRPGGFLTPNAINYVAGIDPLAALLHLLISDSLPDCDALPADRACIYGAVNSEAKGRIVRISGAEHVKNIPNIHLFEFLKTAGDLIVPLPEGTDYHIAKFMLCGDSRAALESIADEIRRTVSVEVEPTA